MSEETTQTSVQIYGPLLFKFSSKFNKSYRDLKIQNKEISQVCRQFTFGFDRVEALADSVARLIFQSTEAGHAVGCASLALGVHFMHSDLPKVEGGMEAIQQYQTEHRKAYLDMTPDLGTEGVTIEAGYQMLGRRSHQDQKTLDLMRTVLEAMLQMGWSTFEIFMTDLLKCALNQASVADLQHYITRAKLESKQVTLKSIIDSKLDMRSSIGELLLEKANLSSFHGWKDGFSEAFPSTRELFDNDELLVDFEIMRNLFVHQQGIVDRKAYSKASKTGRWPGLKIGQRVSLNGQVVLSFFSRSVDLCTSLARVIDDKITRGQRGETPNEAQHTA